MKNHISVSSIIIVFILILSSCKKDYICECSYTNGTQIITGISELEKYNKKEAEKACESFREQISVLGTGATCVLK